MSNENENLELPTNDKEINNKDDSNDNNNINNYSNQLEINDTPTIIFDQNNSSPEVINDFISADEFQKKEI